MAKHKKWSGQGAGTCARSSGSAVSGRGRTVRYYASQRVLVVGDGDFSFSRGLCQQRGTGRLIVATSYDTRDQVLRKYASAAASLKALVAQGAEIRHGVDATRLREQRFSAWGRFDRVIFNFPHTGEQRVHSNRELLRRFFASACGSLAPSGEVHITLTMGPPYTRWGVVGLAEESGWRLRREQLFDPSAFPGYRHCTTLADAVQVDIRRNRIVTHAFYCPEGEPQNAEEVKEADMSSVEKVEMVSAEELSAVIAAFRQRAYAVAAGPVSRAALCGKEERPRIGAPHHECLSPFPTSATPPHAKEGSCNLKRAPKRSETGSRARKRRRRQPDGNATPAE